MDQCVDLKLFYQITPQLVIFRYVLNNFKSASLKIHNKFIVRFHILICHEFRRFFNREN